jgi:hypothetical protein
MHDNLGAGIYMGNNNNSSVTDSVIVRYNTIRNDYVINPTLYQRANGKYGTLDTTGRWAECVINHIQDLTFDQNEIWSLTDTVNAFEYSQGKLIFTNNKYFTKHNDPCNAWFIDGPRGRVYNSFNQYVHTMGLDSTSFLGNIAYNPNGCGITAAMKPALTTTSPATLKLSPESVRIFPDPVEHKLTVTLTAGAAGSVRLEIYDMSGRLLLKQEAVLAQGVNVLGWEDLKQAGILSGTYILRIAGAAGSITHKLLVR